MTVDNLTIGGVYRETDLRFSRRVKVLAVRDDKVVIQTCGDDAGPIQNARPTRVALSRFPKAFKRDWDYERAHFSQQT